MPPRSSLNNHLVSKLFLRLIYKAVATIDYHIKIINDSNIAQKNEVFH